MGRRPTGKPVNLNRPKPVFAGRPNPVFAEQQNTVSTGQLNPVSVGQPNPVSAGQPNPVSAGQPNIVSAGDGILGPRPLISNLRTNGRPVSAGRPTGSAGRPVSAGKLIGSASRLVSAGRPSGSAARTPVPADIHDGLKIFDCPKFGIFTSSSYDEDFSGPDANNLESSLNVSSTITKRIHNIHPTSQIFDCPKSGIFTSSSYDEEFSGPDTNNLESSLNVSSTITKRIHNIHPTSQALADPDWVKVMQAEMQQFRNKKVWALVTLPDGKRAIGTKWILKNKRDARGIVCRNKARLVAQGHRQDKGIDYTDVFASVARIKAI
nr:hypothetical protein [Tanacetum cinerariifolium]